MLQSTQDQVNFELIQMGFKVLALTIRGNGAVIWSSSSLNTNTELILTLPKNVLSFESISRELQFSSVQKIEHLSMNQRWLLNGHCIEEYEYHFGFVIPNSTNSWQNETLADEVMSAEDLSGNLVIATLFMSSGRIICRWSARIYYQ